MLTKYLNGRLAFVAGLIVLTCSSMAFSQQGNWTFLNNATAVPFGGATNALLLPTGEVLVQDSQNRSNWWKLTPDKMGDYSKGTWKQTATMPAGYGPTYYASAVLKSGRVIVEGGEYNVGVTGQAETPLGALYDPGMDVWVNVNPPAGWTEIGDTSGVVLPGGHFPLAALTGSQLAELDESTLTWTVYPGTGKQDSNNEEGWTLLPDGSLLTVDTSTRPIPNHAERLLFDTHTWISAGDTVTLLADLPDDEIGPAVLRPDGTVFATGATPMGSMTVGHTGIYTPPAKRMDTGTWAAGPNFPNFDSIADGPAALLPDGNVLVMASMGYTATGSVFFEFDGTNLNPEPASYFAADQPSYVGQMLVLPTGQIFFTDLSEYPELYNSVGTYNPAWAPVILSAPATVTKGTDYVVSGTQFNGLSQGGMYGDDAQSATNYPLVRVTNTATGHVYYARAHDPSTMAVATGTQIVSTKFKIRDDTEIGPSTLVVVTNGIPSAPVNVTVM